MSYTYFTPIMLANSQSDKFLFYTYLYFLVVETLAMFMENSVGIEFLFYLSHFSYTFADVKGPFHSLQLIIHIILFNALIFLCHSVQLCIHLAVFHPKTIILGLVQTLKDLPTRQLLLHTNDGPLGHGE